MSTDHEGFGLGGSPPYRRIVPAVVAEFRSDSERGLSDAESGSRLRRCGRNELQPQTPPPAWRKFLVEFNNPLAALLIGAAAISMALWAWERNAVLPYEAFAILAIVLFNVSLSYLQKARAEQAVSALQSMTAAHVDERQRLARVLGSGKFGALTARTLEARCPISEMRNTVVPARLRRWLVPNG